MCNRPWPFVVSQPLSCLYATVLALALLAGGCAASAPLPAFLPGVATLTVALEGFRNDRGTAIVSLFHGEKGFPDEVAASVSTLDAAIQGGKATVAFAGLPYGEYALSVLHDEDADGQMATGLLGTPREGFGFSGYPDYRFGHPDYQQVRFLLVEPQREMNISIRYETGRRRHQTEGHAAEIRRPSQE